MVQCPKCQKENPADASVCQTCGADLLPGEGIHERLENLIVGFVGAVVAGGIAYLLYKGGVDSEICFANPYIWGLVAISSPFIALATALRKTPVWMRYARRARRHVELDPQQAIADFTKALETAPTKEKERAKLLKERAALYEKAGMAEEAARDLLQYTTEEGAYDGSSGVARMLGADRDTYKELMAKDERKRLVTEGKAKALGYCRKCRAVVELTPKLRCTLHEREKGKAVKFAVPADVESAKQEILLEYEKQRKTTRKWSILAFVFIGIPVLSCAGMAAFGALMRSLPLSATQTPVPPTSTPSRTAIVKVILPSATPQATQTLAPTAQAEVPCVPGAAFVADVTVPDGTRFAPGDRFTKTWRIRSTKCAPWPQGTRWVFVSGDQMDGPDAVDVPDTPLGGTAEISVPLHAPSEPGTYKGYWQLEAADGTRFGVLAYVTILVE